MYSRAKGISVIDNKSDDKYKSMLLLPEGDGQQGQGGLRTQGLFKETLTDKPLITIVTAVYNGEQFLEKTILSVLNQTYSNLEYIIIDGGSSDGTLDIIKKYEHVIDYWVSEPDKGISDAFNKGVRLAKGDYINFQGDGDGFVGEKSLEQLLSHLGKQRPMLVSARINRIDENDKVLFESKQPKKFFKTSLLFRMSLPHQGLFVHREFFKKYGLFDVENTYCMDYEHLLRAYKDFPDVLLIDQVVAKWRDDGLGNGRELDVLAEYHKIKVKNKVANIASLKAIQYWILTKYYAKKLLK